MAAGAEHLYDEHFWPDPGSAGPCKALLSIGDGGYFDELAERFFKSGEFVRDHRNDCGKRSGFGGWGELLAGVI